jgi:hypothetical protein
MAEHDEFTIKNTKKDSLMPSVAKIAIFDGR